VCDAQLHGYAECTFTTLALFPWLLHMNVVARVQCVAGANVDQLSGSEENPTIIGGGEAAPVAIIMVWAGAMDECIDNETSASGLLTSHDPHNPLMAGAALLLPAPCHTT
jgi:hypothetical protein